MGVFNDKFPSVPIPIPPVLRARSLRTKLQLMLLPPVAAILVVTGYITYQLSSEFLHIAVGRHVKLQTLAMRHELESFLDGCRRDLLFLAQGPLNPEVLACFMDHVRQAGGTHYRELSLLSPTKDGHIFLVARDGASFQVPAKDIESIRPNPMLNFQDMQGWQPGQVRISQIIESEYPFPSEDTASQRIASRIIRLSTPVRMTGGTGILSLAIDALDLRNILSLFNSSQSPLWGFPRSDEVRYAYFMDPDGWMLFQSEDPNKLDSPLTTYLARSGYEGTLGMPGLPSAFRPSSVYGAYWKAVTDVQNGRADLVRAEDETHLQSKELKDYYFAYTPVLFHPGPGLDPVVYGGLTFVDRSKLILTAGYKYLDVMFLVTLGASLFISLLIALMGHLLTKPILRLTRAVAGFRLGNGLDRIEVAGGGYETILLRDAINHLLGVMERQVEEIRIKDEAIKRFSLMERAQLGQETGEDPDISQEKLPEIVGIGPKIGKLKSDILKAARTNVDVLVVGETGTGKQLAAEAIHGHCNRKDKPFIAINCGALDESLLLDTLFGHVRGAFTEARTDRKGAFLEANGGTLFLDEIQAASPKVQQSLLRAIEMRKIKPLGSDKEIDVDVRLIAATNIDLTRAIENGEFREDLYFRLRVISIHTPPLRDHAGSIPSLAMKFLADAQAVVNKENLSLSKGALEKLRSHHWPGNIRELKNAITMASVMAEDEIIQADDIPLSGEDFLPVASGGPEPAPAMAAPVKRPRPLAAGPIPPDGLNPRQERAYPAILAQGEITRALYQALVGGELPSRTAIYDLNDMVERGILRKTGRGPATKYTLSGQRP